MIFQRIRLALAPAAFSGRVRLVLFSMVVAAVVGVVIVSNEPKSDDWLTYYFPMVLAGMAAMLAYVIQFAASGIRWVLDGYDETGRGYFYRFVLLLVLVLAVGIFAQMFRYEISSAFYSSDGCRYLLRDRWTGEVAVNRIECPSDVKPKPRTTFHQRPALDASTADG